MEKQDVTCSKKSEKKQLQETTFVDFIITLKQVIDDARRRYGSWDWSGRDNEVVVTKMMVSLKNDQNCCKMGASEIC